MAIAGGGAVVKEVRAILGTGTVAGLADGEVLERFAARRDEPAFAALVARHGPRVLGVCRQVLGDEPTAELDRASGARLLSSMVELARAGTTFVLASHDPAVCEVADVVIELQKGRVRS